MSSPAAWRAAAASALEQRYGNRYPELLEGAAAAANAAAFSSTLGHREHPKGEHPMTTTETPTERPRLTPAQRRALLLMRVGAFWSAAELRTNGSVLKALGELGLVKPATTRGKGNIVARLTAAGERERRELRLDELLATYAVDGPEGLVLGDVVELWQLGRLERDAVDYAIELRARAAGREYRRGIAEAAVIEELDGAGGALTIVELRRRIEEASGRPGPLAAGDVTAAVDRLLDRGHVKRGRKLVVDRRGTYTVELRKGLRTIEPARENTQ